MKKAVFVILTAFLVLGTVLSVKGTVYSMERDERLSADAYRREEQAYVGAVRALLQSRGIENAGVMLTKVIYGDGIREYELSIHHRELHPDRNAERCMEVLAELDALTLEVPEHKLAVHFYAGAEPGQGAEPDV